MSEPVTVQPIGVGDPAPDFELRDQNGRSVRLSDYAGVSEVLLVFYPFAFTRVCTGELCELRDELPRVTADGAEVLAVSCDPMFSLRAFAESDGLNFPLLSDFWPHGEVSRAYGVFDAVTGSSRRSAFVVDREGRVRWSVHNERPNPRSLEEYVEVLAGLRA